MSKHSRAIEVYEDNAGGLHVFALDGTATGTQVVWRARYYGMEVDAASAYADLLEGGDPVAEGWERGDLDDMDAVRRDYEECAGSDSIHLVASSDCADGDNAAGLMLDCLGVGGKLFARALGIDLED